MKSIKIAVSAGGTGGHIVPALSVCKELINNNIEVYYIGNKNSMESDLVKRVPEIKEFYAINVQRLYRRITIKHFLFPVRLLISIYQCFRYLKKIKPDAFIGFGGFVSGAPAFASMILGVPVYLQEQNCNPGITNKITGYFSKKVFLAYRESFKYFSLAKCIHSGNPIEVKESVKHTLNYEDFNLNQNTKKLLVVGGSQGSLFINNIILENLEWLNQNNIEVIWQTGSAHLNTIQNDLTSKFYLDNKKQYMKKGVYVFDFSDRLNVFYANSDFILCRGGALTLAEAEVYKLPAFIIPLPSAAVNEQYYNACSVQKRKLGVMFEQKDKSQFQDKFIRFVSESEQMYSEKSKHEDVIHLKAAKIIVNTLLKDIKGED